MRKVLALLGALLLAASMTQVVDAGGNTTRIAFDHVVVNVSLPDQLFHFTVPPGVEVLNPSLQQDQQ